MAPRTEYPVRSTYSLLRPAEPVEMRPKLAKIRTLGHDPAISVASQDSLAAIQDNFPITELQNHEPRRNWSSCFHLLKSSYYLSPNWSNENQSYDTLAI